MLGSLPAFGAGANAATFDARLLDWPVPNADVSLYPVLCRHAEQLLAQRHGEVHADGARGIEAQVRSAIVAGLRHGAAKLATIAAARLAGRHTTGQLVLLDRPVFKAGALVMGAAELYGDKMKTAPDRTVFLGLLARVLSAGIAGAALAPEGRE
ncbi:MAG: hypothetical protein RR376_11695, partial [Janthinobacterium sp.]